MNLETLQKTPEAQAIRNVALDYIVGWYDGNPERMASALHPELVKRILRLESGSEARLEGMSKETLVGLTEKGYGKADTTRQADVTVFDIFGNSATARIEATAWIDYLQLVRIDGAWKIANVLWEMKP